MIYPDKLRKELQSFVNHSLRHYNYTRELLIKESNSISAMSNSVEESIRITTGIIELLTFDELIWVIAHEVGHCFNDNEKYFKLPHLQTRRNYYLDEFKSDEYAVKSTGSKVLGVSTLSKLVQAVGIPIDQQCRYHPATIDRIQNIYRCSINRWD